MEVPSCFGILPDPVTLGVEVVVKGRVWVVPVLLCLGGPGAVEGGEGIGTEALDPESRGPDSI
jgi:hypothetical protein